MVSIEVTQLVSFFQIKNPDLRHISISEEDLDQRITDYFGVFAPGSISESVRGEAIRIIKSNANLKLDLGAILDSKEYTPWLDEYWKKAGTERTFWNAYDQYLCQAKNWSPIAVQGIDEKTDEILDHCGNPNNNVGSWCRRGLVIGDVQSGKTAVFTGLLNKAVDAGYRVVIVLTGVLESLRRQTQGRLDLEFVGLTQENTNAGADAYVISVANFRNFSSKEKVICCKSFTDKDSDFKTDQAKSMKKGMEEHPWDNPNRVLLFVLKKHKTVLEQFLEWMSKKENMFSNRNGVQPAVMIIDDEADNASVNTNPDPFENPTTINKKIREILQQCNRVSYVAFTATPFANVFINSDDEDQDLKELFPNDFITCTCIPSSYFGVNRMLNDSNDPNSDEETESSSTSLLHRISDAESGIPLKHKQDDIPSLYLPESLRTAVRQYFLINAIRDLREAETNTHRTMMVNVSRFTDAHKHLKKLIKKYCQTLQKEINVHAVATDGDKNPVIAQLKEDFERDFYDCGKTWNAVKQSLEKSNLDVNVWAISQKSEDVLDYENHKKDGLRVIVIGGFGLARGVTLEGLCVSYLYRTTAYYDTLMQMGRWFGYRPGYGDLCKVWLSPKTIGYYRQIALATEELKEDIGRMQACHKTPRDFGLRVQDSPAALMITSSNKMRSSELVDWEPSMSFRSVETPKLRRADRDNNFAVAESLLNSMINAEIPKDSWSSDFRILYRKVPKKIVADFVRSFRVHPSNYQLANFDDDEQGMSNFIANTDIAALQEWDVVIWGNNPNKSNCSCTLNDSIELGALDRSGDRGAWESKEGVFSIDKNRVSGSDVEAVGFSATEKKNFESRHKELVAQKQTVLGLRSYFRDQRKTPLLVVMPVHLIETKPTVGGQKKETVQFTDEVHLTYCLSFCNFEDAKARRGRVKYRVNQTWMHQYFDVDEEDKDDDE